jgi:hypothetical protein
MPQGSESEGMKSRTIRTILPALLVAVLSGQVALADGPPYDQGMQWYCARSDGPPGTVWSSEGGNASADPTTGSLSASASVAVAGSLPSPIPLASCNGGSVRRAVEVDPGTYEVTATIVVPTTGPDVPTAGSSGLFDAAPVGGASAETSVDLGVFAVTCDENGGCGGGGTGTDHAIVCSPDGEDWTGRPCSNPGSITLSASIAIEPGEFLMAEVSAWAVAMSGYVGTASASVHAVVDDITIEPASVSNRSVARACALEGSVVTCEGRSVALSP